MAVSFLRLVGALNSNALEDAEVNTNESANKVENFKNSTNININDYNDDANDEIEEDWYSLSKDELIERLVNVCNDYADVVEKYTNLLDTYENLLNTHEDLLNKHETVLDKYESLMDDYDAKCLEYDRLVEEYE